MVLHHSDAALHVRLLSHFEPLSWVGLLCRCEYSLALHTRTPLLVGICVHAVVEESVEFGFVPLELTLAWYWVDWSRCVVRIAYALLNQLEVVLC